jgi:predicted TIM-barrel fold metal-dependent hydrolase
VTACDCHVHVFGPRDKYPQIAGRAYTAGLAPLDDLRANGEPLGITRFVIVQASIHGTDNSCLLDSLDALDGHGRGVVVVDPKTIASSTLDDWFTRGARGLRINLYSDYKGADRGPERAALRRRFEELADTTPPGWHVEVIAPMHVLADAGPVLEKSRVPIVIDHYGLPVRLKPDTTSNETPASDNGRRVIDLLRCPHVWMKLSAPYRAIEGPGADPHATIPPAAWVKAFLDAAPERLVWGSDWPHTPPHEDSTCGDAPDPFRPIDYSRMFGDFLLAVSEPRRLEAILAANPGRLYGFA